MAVARRRRWRTGILTWGVASCLALCAAAAAAAAPAPQTPGETPVTGRAEPALAAFDRLMLSFLRDHDVPGAALAVGRHGRLVYARGFGYADVERRRPVEPDALFRVASLSKPITAVAVLQLDERGKLRLDGPAFDLPDLAPHLEHGAAPDRRLARVTVRQLLHHTGGFDRDASFDPMFRSYDIARSLGVESPPGARDVVRYMMGRPMDFDPGSREAYSNFGYCVLGRVVEKASGMTYEDYVRKEVFAPLGVRRARLGRTLEAHRAEGEVRYYPRGDRRAYSVYNQDPGGREVPAAYGAWYLEAMDAHGGWLASAPDLVRFAAALADPDHCPILKAHTIAEMFRRPKVTGYDGEGEPKDAYYACGWMVRPVGVGGGGGKANTWHAGLLDGSAALLVRRHDGLSWAVLFNADYGRDEQYLVGLIDPMIHPVADSVRDWPAGCR